MHVRWAFVATLAALCVGAGTACDRTREPSYADDVDLADLRAQFGCGAPDAGADAREACGILDDFDRGEAFTAYPLTANDVWYGRAVCAADMGNPLRWRWAFAQVRSSMGAFSGPPNVKLDHTRVYDYGIAPVVGATDNPTPEVAEAAREAEARMLGAAQRGTEPALDGLSEVQRGFIEGRIRSVRAPLGNESGEMLVRSKGRSALGTPLVARRRDAPSAVDYYRRAGRKMLLVQPAVMSSITASPLSARAPCVAELWRIEPKG